jgi:hypothetical protein
MLTGEYASGIKWVGKFDLEALRCVPCVIGRQPADPYPFRGNRAEGILDIIHMDICGPFPVTTPHGKHYFFPILDDFINFAATTLLSKKDEALVAFKVVKARWEKTTGHKLCCVQSDNAGEFLSTEFNAYLDSEGILR